MPASDQGSISDRYKLIPRTLIFLTHEDQVLLIKGSPMKRLWANLYNGIGGHIERAEDVLASARRELIEETGITPDALWLCGIITIDTGQEVGIGINVFRGECDDKLIYQSEEGLLEWVSFGEYLTLPLVEDLPTILPIILKMNSDSVPFFAHYTYTDIGALVININH